MRSTDVTETIGTIAGAIFILVVLSALIGAIYTAGAPILGQPSTVDVNTVGQTGSSVEVGGDIQYNDALKVEATTETSLYFNETSSVEASGPSDLTNDSWTVCIAPKLGNASKAPLNLTYDAFAYQNETIVLQLDHGRWSAYYDNGTHDAKVTLPADSPRDDFTPVCTRFDNETDKLSLTNGTGAYASDQIDTTTDSRNLSTGWVGFIDEVRTFRTNVSNTTITTFQNDHIEPLPNTNRASRIMFDEESGSETHVYFDGSRATVVDAEWTTGIAGPDIVQGTDYELSKNPLRIKLLTSGYMDGAPVVFVSNEGDMWWNVLQQLSSFGTTAFVLFGLVTIILGARYALDSLNVGSGGR